MCQSWMGFKVLQRDKKNCRQQARSVNKLWFCFRLHKPSSNLNVSTWNQIIDRKINESFHSDFFNNIYFVYMELKCWGFFLICYKNVVRAWGMVRHEDIYQFSCCVVWVWNTYYQHMFNFKMLLRILLLSVNICTCKL